jgi:hypothetical protein
MMSAAPALAVEPATPQVTESEAFDDRDWFALHPQRLFRARPASGGVWLIRRRHQGEGADVLLRTLAPLRTPPADDDLEIAAAWFAVAFWLHPKTATKLAQRLLKGGRGRR